MKFGISIEVEPAQPVDEPVEGGGVHAAAGLGDLVPHRLPAVSDIDRAAVGEAGPVRRVEPPHRKQLSRGRAGIPVAARRASAIRSGMVSTVGPVSKVNPSRCKTPARPPGMLFSLDDGHVVAAAGEVAGRGQAGQAGPNHHNRSHLCVPTMISVM